MVLPQAAQAGGVVPSGFQDTIAINGLTEPTSVTFSPDGRIFVTEKSGVIKVFDGISDKTATVFADLSPEVYNFWDRGLLGLALDPEFPLRPYIYVLYSYDAVPGGSPPRWGGTSPSDSCPTPPGPTADGCVITGRLSKLTAVGDVMSTETPLITDWCQQYPSHSIGDLAFGGKGELFVSGGEGANFNVTDWGQLGNPINPCGDPPGGVGGLMPRATAEGGALRAQDVRTTGDPTSLSGAVLRIDPDTGEGLPGNPLSASPDANARRIVAYGFRNPFRFTIRPGTKELWIGDVGAGTWEEIDRLQNPTAASPTNFGWPCYEGDNSSSARQPSWDAANIDLCESLYGQGPSAVTAPYFSYKHPNTIVPGEACSTGSSSTTGLSFYEASQFPSKYQGALFFADHSRDCIWAMLPGSNGLPDPNNIINFDVGSPLPVDLQVGPDGALYYADLGGGKIRHITYTAGNQTPVAEATATPQDGPTPLEVHFDASGSSDPDLGDTLSFSWDFNDDGQFGDATSATPTFLYTQAGTHTATVKVTDNHGASNTASVVVQVGNTPPSATITSPGPSLTWAVGDPIEYAGTATDEQDGELPASAYSWHFIMHHCPSNCHSHPVQTIGGQTSGVMVAPDHEYPSWLEIQLTVTDSGGLTNTKSVTVFPKTATINFQTLPLSGFLLNANEAEVTTPGSVTVIKGSKVTVAARPEQSVSGTDYAFESWSDGGDSAHDVTVGDDMTLTAKYVVRTGPAVPTITAISPPSGSNNNSPKVIGTLGAGAPTEVKIYASANCTGTPTSATSAQFTGEGAVQAVNNNTTTSYSAKAADAGGTLSACSNSLTYVEDSIGPSPPALTAVSPSGPANNNGPKVIGTVGAGAPTEVKIYKTATCTGATTFGTIAEFTGAGIGLVVAKNATTAFSAKTLDAAGNPSTCSNSLTYTEDSTPPAAPTITAISPPGPANNNSPKVIGTLGTGAPTEVKVYPSANCTGTPNSATIAQFTGEGAVQAVNDNTTTAFSAKAADAAGNLSACSNSLSYAEVSTGPAAPTITAISPPGPANNNSPKVIGTLGAGSPTEVRVYPSANCTGTPTSATIAQFTGEGAVQAVNDNTTTDFSAKAADAAGILSTCSNSLSYTEDSTGPAVPTITAISPPSGSNNNSPKVIGTLGAGAPTEVKIYASANCTGTPTSATVAQFTGEGAVQAVNNNTTTSYSAKAADAGGTLSACSNSLTYVEDSIGPSPPALTAVSPSGPANNNGPKVIGTVGAGAPTEVKIYKTATCTGATTFGTIAEFTGAGIGLVVAKNATTAFSAKTLDAAGNPSTCSNSLTYTEDSTPPAAPTITAISPPGPANNNSPKVIGTLGTGAPTEVKVYPSANCTGTPNSATIAQFTGEGAVQAVNDNTTTAFSAKAADAAGNLSACSNSLSYAEVSTGPAAPTITAISPPGPANNNSPKVIGTLGAGSPTEVRVYPSANCTGTPTSATIAQFTGEGAVQAVNDNTTTDFSAKAADAAGILSTCSNSLSYTEDSTGPAVPTITAISPPSGSNNNSPKVIGTLGAGAPTEVKIYASANCTGTPTSATVAQFTGEGAVQAVNNNTTTSYSAKAADAGGTLSACSNSLTYVEDSIGPSPPALTAVSPSGPANNNGPKVIGTVGAGAPTEVKIYKTATCTGATTFGTIAEFTGAGIGLVVAKNATTAFSAKTLDAAGNPSTCSNSLTYTEDSTPPAAPTITAISPPGPANNNSPKVIGTLGTGAPTEVKVYPSANCTGTPNSATIAQFTGEGAVQAVNDNTTTAFSAKAADAAGNLSACSNSLSYIEDSNSPQTKILGGPPANLRVAVLSAFGRYFLGAPAIFSFRSNERGAHFECRLGRLPYSPCSSPYVYLKARPGTHVFSVRAADLAANVDPTAASRTFRFRVKR